MDDYDPLSLEQRADQSGGRWRGLSLQTGASVLLIGVIAAVLWLFLGPMPDGGSTADLPTATATRAAGVAGTPVPVGTGTLMAGAAAPVTATASVGVGFVPGPVALGTALAGAPAAAIRPGAFASVADTGLYGLRLRYGPGADYLTIRIVAEGEPLLVLDESTQVGPATWWRVQDVEGNVGWVDQAYLRPGPAPASWAPPAASPTFAAPAGPPTP